MDVESCIAKLVGEYQERQARMLIIFSNEMAFEDRIFVSKIAPERYQLVMNKTAETSQETREIYVGSLVMGRKSLIIYLKMVYASADEVKCYIGEPQEGSSFDLKNHLIFLAYYEVSNFFELLMDVYDGCFV